MTDTKKIEILQAEDIDAYWVEGHDVTEEQMREAVAAYADEIFGAPGSEFHDPASYAAFQDIARTAGKFRRWWMRDYIATDITDEELEAYNEGHREDDKYTKESLAAMLSQDRQKVCRPDEPGAAPWTELSW